MSFDAPDACTLPTAEQPFRLAKFDELFATAVQRVEKIADGKARMLLSGPAGLLETVRDLTARETECCSFYTFTVTAEPDAANDVVVLDIEVPPAYAGVLASLTQRASALSAGSAGSKP